MHKPHSWAPIITCPLQSGCQQKNGGQPKLLWFYETQTQEADSRKHNAGGRCLLCMNPTRISNSGLSGHPYCLGIEELHPDTYQMGLIPENSCKPQLWRLSHQLLLNHSGTWAMTKGCWNWQRARRALIASCHTATSCQMILSPLLSFPSHFCPKECLYRIIPEDARRFGGEKKALMGMGREKEKKNWDLEKGF